MSIGTTLPLTSAAGVGLPSSIHSWICPSPESKPTGRAFSLETFIPLYSLGLWDAVIWTEALKP